MPPHAVEETSFGLAYAFEQEEPSELYGKGGTARIRYEYTLYMPFTIHLNKIEEDGVSATMISMATTPVTPTTSELYVWIVRNHSLGKADHEFGDFTNVIMEQDRVVVESQRAKQLPSICARNSISRFLTRRAFCTAGCSATLPKSRHLGTTGHERPGGSTPKNDTTESDDTFPCLRPGFRFSDSPDRDTCPSRSAARAPLPGVLDQRLLDAEATQLFAKDWVLACREQEIPSQRLPRDHHRG